MSGSPEKSPLKRLFWWTLGIFGALLIGLVLLSLTQSDSPFTYVLQ